MPSVQRRALGEISNRANTMATPSASVKKNISNKPIATTTATPATRVFAAPSFKYPEPEIMGKPDDPDLSDEEFPHAEIET